MAEAIRSRSYKDLEVWQLAIAFVKDVYKATETFPSSENFGLRHQIRKAAVSIPANLAEGQSRNSSKEFKQFIAIAMGSAAEMETHLIISGELDYLTSEPLKVLLNTLERIMKMLRKLSISLT